jgi:hypothetical protein
MHLKQKNIDLLHCSHCYLIKILFILSYFTINILKNKEIFEINNFQTNSLVLSMFGALKITARDFSWVFSSGSGTKKGF